MEALISSIVRMLGQSGIFALYGLETASFPILKGPMVAISILTADSVKESVDGYFGCDSEGTAHYGRVVKMVCLMDVYSPESGKDCWSAASKLVGRLMRLVEGAAYGSAEVGKMHYDSKIGCFRCEVRVPLTVILYNDPK